MNQVVEFMKSLLETMEDTNWCITGMEEFKEVQKDDKTYAEIDEFLYEKQGDIFIYQTTGYLGDDYSGTIIKPITDKIALVIQYDC